ncbi:FAD-dependent oxidoreductase [Roseobacter sp. HKCCD9010]|uniref:GcvT family protein n=1 Tax=unclassified Roseobacter TaxID=196798 RepID=UPI0014922452|nr:MULTISPECIES: FAD-dependent oxidoreductase [unclassified Roseobacter]MBF9049495.1 FAD-dependent oxidoreductase [Rhodobacterales bacterium HKCCD4356]NNV11495.1 FAD-dependent oxidoreductase [Roseobacter sp. HKCCD7357]NNV15679.1 FAD-dependent oxidoreductase [Roseobacter sp. HKCCD8768]NNV25139.1 FAD-dependent oxidoreductase [Roseobacter sp. HKCCD8192]NNV29396.1 FAD-dependent oxidoreductase [Roseobacter sp. HKCCD9061]
MSQIPSHARVVIVGGGVAGCSVAYHLTKLGWTDVVLLERKRLTSGTTWHAAGLIAQLRASKNMTRLAKYSQELYSELEAETGIATGFRRCGSITMALTEARREEVLRQASMARAFGVEVEEITDTEVKSRYPHVSTDGMTAAVYLPLDGQGDPANIAMAMAKGARRRGAKVIENVKVTGVSQEGGRVTGVSWDQGGETGTITCDHVVNCAGMWARDFGAMAGVNVPLQACEHFYIVTENIPNLTQLPVLRVPDECAYYKEDAGKILLGAFEPVAKPWGPIPEDFEFDQLPEDFDHFEPILEQAIERVPMLAEAGIHTFFNGPESFTPDDAYHLGPAPNLDGYWVAAGFNSIGIQSAGGAGMALAHWMDTGLAPFDIGDVDIQRAQPFQRNKRYLKTRASETLGLLYADHFPYRQKATARGIRRSPLHEHLKAQGAVFGEFAGWERANWFANPGQAPEYDYSWGRQNWFDNQRAEHEAVREGVGLYDMSSFGKIRVEGRDAEAFLNFVAGGDMSVPVGRIVYSQLLNANAGIEADVTITRLSETAYLIVTPAATLIRDLAWLHRHKGNHSVVLTDMTAAEAVICVMGPKSRDVMRAVSPADWSGNAFPFGWAREIEIGMGLARAHRVTYVGELGWELYVSTDQAAHVFETLLEAGAAHGMKLCGLHMMDSCRIEKGFRHFGHDITGEDHVLEAGLGFAVKTAKPDFIGRDAVLRRKDEGLQSRLLQFQLTEPEPLLFHAEPILRDGEIVGYITSGNYGHTLGASIGMGYVPCPGEAAADVLASSYEIEVAGDRIAATPSLKPLYDPKSERVKA